MKFSTIGAALLANSTIALARAVDIRQEEVFNNEVREWIAQVAPEASISEVFNQANSLLRTLSPLNPAHTYEFTGFHGFALTASESVLKTLQAEGLLTAYEPNTQVEAEQFIEERQSPSGPIVTQQNAGYNLARISSRTPGGSEYRYRAEPGKGTFIYILDSGMNIAHEDFGGRASHGATFSRDESPKDTDGHGIAVGGLAGGTRYGVAKAASIINVKVTDGASGGLSQVLAGIDWTAKDVQSKGRRGKAIANLSLGVFNSQILDNAANALSDAGVFVVAAAGNNSADARDYSPGRAEKVCNVACSNSTDGRAFFSNFGPSVDLFGPGDLVVSPAHTSRTGTKVSRGTSEAAPQVAGLGAYLIGLGLAGEGGQGTCDVLKGLATKGVIGDLRGSPNLLVYNGIGP